jgi:hypothetical protein
LHHKSARLSCHAQPALALQDQTRLATLGCIKPPLPPRPINPAKPQVIRAKDAKVPLQSHNGAAKRSAMMDP